VCDDGSCCVSRSSGAVCVGQGMACPTLAGTCQGGSCGACGGVDQSCCGIGSDWCSASGTRCLQGAVGAKPKCTLCGTAGQPCCDFPNSTVACRTGLKCTNTGGDNWVCQ
jgi:hypothetical protein